MSTPIAMSYLVRSIGVSTAIDAELDYRRERLFNQFRPGHRGALRRASADRRASHGRNPGPRPADIEG